MADDYFSRALRTDGDAGELIDVQSPVNRPAPIPRPGAAPPPAMQPQPRSVAPPAGGGGRLLIPDPNGDPVDFFLPNDRFDLLSPSDQQRYIAQRNNWLDSRQGVGRYAPAPNALSPQAPQAAPNQPPMPDAPPAQPPAQNSAGGDYFSRALRSGQPQQPQAAKTPAVDPNAEADAPTWLGRRAQDIRGKRDPRYAGLPAMAEVLNKEGNIGFKEAATESGAWLTGASDKDMVGVYKGFLGDRFVRSETDANGYPVIVYRGQDGREAKAYANVPGLDVQDVVRGATGIAPFVGAGRLIGGAMKGSAMLPRVGAQAAGGAATSVAQDAAGVATGVSDVDLERTVKKAGVAAAGGAGSELFGQAVGYLWRRLVTEPKYFNRATGQLTPEGAELVRQAGMDPAGMAQDAAKTFATQMARTGDAAAATRQTISSEFKIPRTKGELTGSQQDLLREQQMLGGGYGTQASEAMQNFRRTQDRAINSAVDDIGNTIAPARAGQDMTKAELGASIRSGAQGVKDTAKEFERQAWKGTEALSATDEMLAELPRHIQSSVPPMRVSAARAPQSTEMMKSLDEFMAGGAPEPVSKMLPASPVRDVNAMRQDLYDMMKGAAPGSQDAKLAGSIYGAFNDWINTAAKMAGDPTIAARYQVARGITRQNAELFKGQPGSAGARIMKDVLERTDNAEGIVNALFGSPGKSEIKGGAVQALESLKKAYDTYWPRGSVEGRAAWDDIRLAYWFKMTENRTGEAFGPAQLASNIKAAFNNQQSVTNLLFDSAERSRMLRLASVLDDIKKRNPNTSWSGVSMGALMKDLGNALVSMIGGNSIIGRTALGVAKKPIESAYGKALLENATGRGAGAALPALPPPPVAGYGAGYGANQDR